MIKRKNAPSALPRLSGKASNEKMKAKITKRAEIFLKIVLKILGKNLSIIKA